MIQTRNQAVARIADRNYLTGNWRLLINSTSSNCCFPDIGPKRTGVMTLTFQGHVTSAAIRFAIGHFLLVIRLATIYMLPTDDRQTDRYYGRLTKRISK